MKAAVIYWSGTGNTEAMAVAVAQGARNAGVEVELLTSAEFDASLLDSCDALAFGCPAMGEEVLEEDEFEPMFAACESLLAGKKVALFGSYGWGDGEWMRSWEERCAAAGITLCCGSVICQEMPDDAAKAECEALGAALA